MKLLAGDRALVTGAGGGIGRGIAQALKDEGAEVYAADLADGDLRSVEEARRLAQKAIDRLETVSLFVHAACPRRQEGETVLEVSDAQWREMLSVSLDAAFAICQTLGRHMVERQVKGRMLLITSLHAGSPRNLPHYSAAKAGETMLVKELARALGPRGIRVNALAPGAVPGGGFQARPGMVESIALRRFGTPADVAAMAVAVLSERFGAYVTGTTLVVDGGLALRNWIEPPHAG